MYVSCAHICKLRSASGVMASRRGSLLPKRLSSSNG